MVLKADRHAFFKALAALNPNPKTELDYVNTYTLLVAVALSAQSTDKGVNKATKELFKIADTPEKMVALGLDRLTDHIKTIGLYRNKAKNVLKLSEILIEKHGGTVPEDRAALEALPGVGRKTANVILNEAFGHPTCAVDTHIFRIANRTRLAPGKTPDKVEDRLVKIIPAEFARPAHHHLILFGRYLCKARNPDCDVCPVWDICRWKDKKPRDLDGADLP